MGETHGKELRNVTIHELFHRQVEKTPNHLAIFFRGISITYGDLNEQSNQLARLLLEKGIKKEFIVGIIVERSIEAIIAMLAVLKAGGAYLPIDVELPQERIRFMLEDAGCNLVITKGQGNKIFNKRIIDITNKDYLTKDKSELKNDVKSTNLAYLIYTSGSTGKPKGVLIEHKGIANLQLFAKTKLKISSDDRILQFNNLSFDASVGEIFQALLTGASLYIIAQEYVGNFEKFIDFINEHRISVISMTPAYLEYIDPNKLTVDKLLVITGGSKVTQEFVNRWGRRYRYINEYGPTEATINATFWENDRQKNELEIIPIGKALPNTEIIILGDKDEVITVPGVPGEICIAGIGLARGYLNHKKLTNEKFVHHPFKKNERMYKTGDKGQLLPDGNIEFIGRIDNQVKLRGYRIELEEIENCILGNTNIKEATVSIITDQVGKQQIAAYYVADKKIDHRELKEFLANILPGYMLPSYYHQMDSMPLTANGKINVKGLPVINVDSKEVGGYIEPTTEMEKKLAQLWKSVLGFNEIGIDSPFFEVGGDSLKAINLVSNISNIINVDVSLNELIKLSTIRNLAKYIDKLDRKEAFYYPKIVEGNINEDVSFPLTAVQMAYLMGRNESFEIGGISTNGYIEFEANIDILRLNKAINRLIERHSSLRTVILEDGTQKILINVGEFQIDYTDLSMLSDEDKQEKIIKRRSQLMVVNMDPHRWPLFSLEAFILSNEKVYFFLIVDPIICDDSSFKIILKEIKLLYEDLEVDLPIPRINFRDYVLKLKEFENSDIYKMDKLYWKEKLNDFPAAPMLPMQVAPEKINIPRFGKQEKFMSHEEWMELKRVSREHNMTVSSLLCAAYAYVLAFWSNSDRFAINLTVFNRMPVHEDVEKIVGDFTTLLLLDIRVEHKRFWDFVLTVQEILLEALQHRHYDGVDVIRQLARKNAAENKALMPIVFTSGLNEQNGDSFNNLVDFSKIKYFSTRTSQVYLDNQVYEINNGLYITWDYVEQLFSKNVIDNMFIDYISILHQIVDARENITIQVPDEDQYRINKYNTSQKKFPRETLISLFQKSVSLLPDKIAIKHHEDVISFADLDKKSNQVAELLKDKGILSKDYVGVHGKRCIGSIICILGILKVGGAYIPIDPEYPDERKRYITEKSNCKLILDPDILESDIFDKYPGNIINTVLDEYQMAYVIFTSGSTGQPKGVKITHAAAVNTILDINERFEIGKEDNVLGISSLCFDLSVYDIFGSLSSGALLVLLDDQRDVFSIKEIVEREKITVWNSVPAIMETMLNTCYDENVDANLSMRVVMLSGDWIPLQLPQRIWNYFSNAQVYSLGGATEASIWSIYFPITEVRSEWKSILYGMPLANQTIYILNNSGQLVPCGVEGEIYIGGTGVADGYLNDPEKTERSFIEHPLLGKIYRTGDFGRFHEDGYVEFLGRKDSQIKVRGFRIELGEIEFKLEEYTDIKKVAAIDYEDQTHTKKIAAFYTGEHRIPDKKLKEFLLEQLPTYMIPDIFIKVDEIPLSFNGKVKKNELIKYINILPSKEVKVIKGPQTDLQKNLCKIWERAFENEINIDSEFYEIGGDSLKAIIITAEIRKQLHMDLPVRELFKKSTIENISVYLENNCRVDQEVQIQRVKDKKYYPASNAQKRMFFLSQLDKEKIAYHVPMALLLEGEVDADAVEKIINQLISRHEILRTSFVMKGNELIQIVHPRSHLSINSYKLDRCLNDNDSYTITSELCKKFVQEMVLTKAPLMRAEFVKFDNDKNILLLDFHHMIADGISQGIFVDEFSKLLLKEELPEIKIRYRDFSEWEKECYKLGILKPEEEYWLNKFVRKDYNLQLPSDYKKKDLSSYQGENFFFGFSTKLSDKIRFFLKNNGITLYMFMMSVYDVLLYKYTNQKEIVVGSAVTGRSHPDLQKVFGVFVNTIAIKNDLHGDATFLELLRDVKENIMEGFENSRYPFEELISKLGGNKKGNNPLFNTMLVVENIDAFKTEAHGIRIQPLMFDLGISKFDITFTVLESKESNYSGNIEYSSGLFEKNTIKRLKEHFVSIIKAVIENPLLKLEDIDILTESEYSLFNKVNSNSITIPEGKSVLDYFVEQVKSNRNRIAISSLDEKTTYYELYTRACTIAQILQKRKVSKGDIVPIIMRQTSDFIASVLGILASGACYLPIDPVTPKERIDYIINDCGCNLLVTEKIYENISGVKLENIFVDELTMGDTDIWPNSNILPEDVAYVIYTSGTTGAPKGVVVEHKALLNLCFWHIHEFSISSSDIATKYASIGFDASVWEIFPYIISGAQLCIIPEDIKLDIKRLNSYFEEQGITTAFLPTQIFEQFIKRRNSSLKRLLTGASKLNFIMEQNYELYNNYGPTENTVVSTCFKIDKLYENIPIGKPICNTKVYIVDENNKLQPIGVPGELCVTGNNLARGYLNNPELTQDKFVENPFEPGTRIYKTGDMARWKEDGNIEFLGRRDKQVKIRGNRVELEEIESAIIKLNEISQAAVIVKNDNLYAYVVQENGNYTCEDVKDILSQKLPSYMLPREITFLERMPVNINGKIDYSMLPEDVFGREKYKEIKPAETITERCLLEIWKQVLEIELISIDDKFYELGGDSLKAAILLHRINTELKLNLSISDIFENETIQNLGNYIEGLYPVSN